VNIEALNCRSVFGRAAGTKSFCHGASLSRTDELRQRDSFLYAEAGMIAVMLNSLHDGRGLPTM